MASRKYLSRIIFLISIFFVIRQTDSYTQLPPVIQISLGRHTVEEGKMVSIPLSIKSTDQIAALKLILNYDASTIELSHIAPVETVKDKAIF